MTDSLRIAVSGLTAAARKAQASAANIANASVPDYKPVQSQDVSQQAGPLSPAGVLAEFNVAETAGVDLVGESVNLMMASAAYKANAAVIKAEAENAKVIRDILDLRS